MADPYIEVGEKLSDDPEHLTIEAARRAARAVIDHPDFELLELRRWGDSEVLVVECQTDAVWSQNPVGIKYRERLALRFMRNPLLLPEVRALRADFPITLHQNHI